MSNQFPPNSASPFSVQPDQPQQQSDSGAKVLVIILAVIGGVIVLCGGVLVALLLPAINAGKTAAQTMTRSNNLKMVGLGIHNYHSAYKQLPLTVAADANGETLVGWRVGLSPFIEGQMQWEIVTENYVPGAQELVADNPPLSLQALDAEPGFTGIFAIVSDQSAFPPTPNTKVQFRDILDGLANTVLAVDLPNRSAPWTSDRNMSPEEAYQAISELQPGEIALVLMGDGAVITVTSEIDRENFLAMTTIAGGENVDSITGEFP